MKKNFYYKLGIKENASLSDIKDAYRKLSKKLHPDANQGDKFFEDQFKDLQEAYETLSNLDKKRNYDNTLKSDFFNDRRLLEELKAQVSVFQSKISEQKTIITKIEHDKSILNNEILIYKKRLSQPTEREYHLEKKINELEKVVKETKKEDESGSAWQGILGVLFLLFMAFQQGYISFGKTDKEIETKYENLKNVVSKASEVQPFIVNDIDFSNSEDPEVFDKIFKASNIRYIHPRLKVTVLSESLGNKPLHVKYFNPNGELNFSRKFAVNGYTFTDTIEYSPNNEFLYLTGWGNEKENTYEIGKHTVEIYDDKGRQIGKSNFYVE